MKPQYYLRIANDYFGFLVKGVHDIQENDIGISTDDYELFFDLQSKGKQFRLRKAPIGSGLFDYLEEFVPEVTEKPQELGAEGYLLDLEYRVSLIELGV